MDDQSNDTDTKKSNKSELEDYTLKYLDEKKQIDRRKRHLESDPNVAIFRNGRNRNNRRINRNDSKTKVVQKYVQNISVSPKDVKTEEKTIDMAINPSKEALRMKTIAPVIGKKYQDLKRVFQKRLLRPKHEKLKNIEESEESNRPSDEVSKKSEFINKKRINKKELDDEEEIEERLQKKKQKKMGKDTEKLQKRNKLNVANIVQLSKGNKEFYGERIWPRGVVFYVIDKDRKYDIENLRSRLEEVNSILKAKTCVRIQEIMEEETKRYEDYLVIDASPDYVTGRVGGRQVFGSVELLRGGQHRQHTAMMVMAMLGFYFEVARHDRDEYIRVHTRHVRPDKLHHFEKIREEATLPLPYDYRSATHPAWQFWRKIGKTGISTVATFKQQDPDGSVMRSLGQNEELLSEIDIVKINSVYGADCFHTVRSKINQKVVGT